MWELPNVAHFLETPLRKKSRRSLVVMSKAKDDFIDPTNLKNIIKPLAIEQLSLDIYKMMEERAKS